MNVYICFLVISISLFLKIVFFSVIICFLRYLNFHLARPTHSIDVCVCLFVCLCVRPPTPIILKSPIIQNSPIIQESLIIQESPLNQKSPMI